MGRGGVNNLTQLVQDFNGFSLLVPVFGEILSLHCLHCSHLLFRTVQSLPEDYLRAVICASLTAGRSSGGSHFCCRCAHMLIAHKYCSESGDCQL
ncbi:hypothetical protein RRG08_020015 [Elysia crispata]|uniref:Uncharacterized protein n=1 Tax=Elysia crispata TaxID=231223 RepID=A0AAE1BAR9_9GAST|nr:hypothetical protein RRG08_020015 [Elysia crispata]